MVDVAVLNLMEERGGSFVSNLAKAWMHADLGNRAKLMVTFGDIYKRYEGMLSTTNKRQSALNAPATYEEHTETNTAEMPSDRWDGLS